MAQEQGPGFPETTESKERKAALALAEQRKKEFDEKQISALSEFANDNQPLLEASLTDGSFNVQPDKKETIALSQRQRDLPEKKTPNKARSARDADNLKNLEFITGMSALELQEQATPNIKQIPSESEQSAE